MRSFVAESADFVEVKATQRDSRMPIGEVLRTVQRELGRLFDTRTFYIAFMESDEVRFELELNEGVTLSKRARRGTNGITEFIVRTGEPILVRSAMDKMRERLGIVPTGRPAKCFCGVPIFSSGRAVGVMAALNFDREFVYEQRDLDVMKTAAGQVAVAMENARLFAEEQRRAKYLEFLNSVSKTAISSQEPEASHFRGGDAAPAREPDGRCFRGRLQRLGCGRSAPSRESPRRARRRCRRVPYVASSRN